MINYKEYVLLDKSIIAQVSINVPEGKELEVNLVDKVVKVYTPYYTKLGNGKDNRRVGMKAINAIEVFSKFTPQEWFVFKMLVNESLVMDDKFKYYTTCKVVIPKIVQSKLSATDKVVFTKGYQRLRDKRMVLRVKRGGSYMINPGLVVPSKYNEEIKEWSELVTNTLDKTNSH